MACVKRCRFDVSSTLACRDQRFLKGTPAVPHRLYLHRSQLPQTTAGCVVVPCGQVGFDALRDLLQGHAPQIALDQHPVMRRLPLYWRQHGKTPLRARLLFGLTKSGFNLVGMNLLAA
jgi:hypothetical protein